ncbi:uncharacterized protein [Lolium perenne]|uniref:uncharacterized protein isoform X4 n=1 Tax=Lolium perenne TaxID=4522 RepID=UPI0021F546E1|nr:uncharacterized protein LOC127314161 isoform X5 [Lolium perenne]
MASVAGKNPLPQHSAPLLWPHPCRPSSSRGLSTPSPPSLPLATTIPPLERQESGEIRGELPAANEVLGDSHTSGDVCGEPQGGNEFRRKKSLRKVTIMQPEGISPTVGSNGSLSHATDSLIVRMIVLNSADVLPFRRNVDGDAMLNSGPLVVSRSGDEHDLRRSFRCSFRTWLMTQVTVSTYGLFHIRHNQNYLTNSIEDSVCDIVIGLFLDTILYQHLTVAFLEHLYMLEL